MPELEPHLTPDAPIHQLLSISTNPKVLEMSNEELAVYIQRLRTYANSAPTLSAKLAEDSNREDPRKRNTAASARRQALADI